jgi:hypothetical protein
MEEEEEVESIWIFDVKARKKEAPGRRRHRWNYSIILGLGK